MVPTEWWFMYGNHTPTLRSHFSPSFDSTSIEHSNRTSVAGISAFGYDGSRGEGTNDGSDPGNDGGDARQQQKVENHWHLFVKMISHIVLKMKITTLEELVQLLEPLESHIEEDNEDDAIQRGLIVGQF
ncbi:hypothetical protein CK203_085691 [Vitis vinifera]|uniref:Uncharacterized protein n=1 Tax=Vitis vinifera TaxID=29760 RepID=A0A438BLM2_VITVI|nr:hypothetical protein CK203_085691 [Vitis vinifera]